MLGDKETDVLDSKVHLCYTNLYKYWIMVTAVAASSPDVGSSRKMIPGDTISSIAILVLFFSPPDIPRFNAVPT